MAAFPSISTSSSSSHLDDSSAIDSPRPSTKRGKRPRDLSSAQHYTQPLKKQKVHPQGFLQPKVVSPTHTGKDFPVSRKVSLTRLRNAPDLCPPFNGAISTERSKNSVLESQNVAAGIVANAEKVEARNLRSHDGGSRSKSELALYFPNYDEILSMEARDPEFLTADTPIHITDEPIKSTTTTLQPAIAPQHAFHKPRALTSAHSLLLNGFTDLSEGLDEGLNKSERMDFSSMERGARQFLEDPLGDAIYLKAHRRAERQEKQLRNIEKERAQHEKVQLERLLEGLKGHDWLRVMGINGITDSEKKSFEPKRDFFIQEVSSLIDKFKIWKEEEKRRKAEKEQNQLAEDGSEDESEAKSAGASDGDVDTWTAKQPPQEAKSAIGEEHRKGKRNRVKEAKVLPLEKPFTSFYSKPHVRAAAIGKHRRGRAKFAFGQPLPDVAEKSFELPPDMLSQDALAASARSRRRARRGSKDC